jgi:inorganic pyrophosphatase/exopolyphosphatase
MQGTPGYARSAQQALVVGYGTLDSVLAAVALSEYLTRTMRSSNRLNLPAHIVEVVPVYFGDEIPALSFILQNAEVDVAVANNIQPGTPVVMVGHHTCPPNMPGLDEAEVLAVVDHQPLRRGEQAVESPNWLIQTAPSTCSIVSRLFREARLRVSRGTAVMLLSEILVRTKNLTYRVTPLDYQVEQWLAPIMGRDHSALFGGELLLEISRPFYDLARQDQAALVATNVKEYAVSGLRIGIALVPTANLSFFVTRDYTLQLAVEILQSESQYDVFILQIANLLHSESLLLVTGTRNKNAVWVVLDGEKLGDIWLKVPRGGREEIEERLEVIVGLIRRTSQSQE